MAGIGSEPTRPVRGARGQNATGDAEPSDATSEPSRLPALPPPDRALALRGIECLGRLAASFNERRRQLAEGAGLTDQQWQVLEEIQREHFMPSLFAAQRESTPAAVSKILRQLTDKGLVTAEVSEEDARHRNYSVTERGKDVLRGLREERERAIETVWLAFAGDELEAFASFGEELARRLETLARKKV